MQSFYQNQPSQWLREMQSKKRVRLQNLEHEFGWFNQQERERLKCQLHWIEVELASRQAQLPLL